MYIISQNPSTPSIKEMFNEKEVIYNTRFNVIIDVDDDDNTLYERFEFKNFKSKYNTLWF